MTDQGPHVVYGSQYERLKAIEAEYRLTIRVVAVLAERVLNSGWTKEGTHEIAIDDAAMLDCPELIAWRDEEKKQTVIRVRR